MANPRVTLASPCMEGNEVAPCRNGEASLKSFLKHSFDICLIDVMLPNALRLRARRPPSRGSPALRQISRCGREIRYKQRLAGRPASQIPTPARQFAACPEFSRYFLPCLPTSPPGVPG